MKRCILIEKVPDELKGLSQLEEMLIARIYPLITVYTVKGGQRKDSKHVINFPQNLNRLATQLPRLPGLVVTCENRWESRATDHLIKVFFSAGPHPSLIITTNASGYASELWTGATNIVQLLPRSLLFQCIVLV